MADTLGVRPVNLAPDMAYQSSLLSGIQQLGNQLRSDLQTIQTNKQLQSFSEQLKGISPSSMDFAPSMVQAISANPLAANSQAGRSAIGMLGAAHESYLREQAAIAASDRQFNHLIGGIRAMELVKNRPYGSPVPSQRELTGGAFSGRENTPTNQPSIPASDFVEPPLSVSDDPLKPQPELIGPPMPDRTPGNHTIPQSPLPLDNIGAQLEAFNQALKRSGIPASEAKGLQREFVQGLMRPSTTRGQSSPRVLAPGAQLIDPTGKVLAENPISKKSNPLDKQLSDWRAQAKEKRQLAAKVELAATQAAADYQAQINSKEPDEAKLNKAVSEMKRFRSLYERHARDAEALEQQIQSAQSGVIPGLPQPAATDASSAPRPRMSYDPETDVIN